MCFIAAVSKHRLNGPFNSDSQAMRYYFRSDDSLQFLLKSAANLTVAAAH